MCGPEARGGTGWMVEARGLDFLEGRWPLEALKRLGISQVFSCVTGAWRGGADNIPIVYTQSLQSYLTLCDTVDCSLPGSSVHGILQARILEWVTISSSRGSSPPRDRTLVSCIAGRYFTIWATREALKIKELALIDKTEIDLHRKQTWLPKGKGGKGQIRSFLNIK